MNWLCHIDRKFAVKARLSGMLPVTSGLLKRCHGEQQSLITVLSVMKTLADNGRSHCVLPVSGGSTYGPVGHTVYCQSVGVLPMGR